MAKRNAGHNYSKRTLDRLRADPRFTLVGTVEKFVQFPPPGHRVDLFGFIDIIAIGPGITLAVQSTSKKQISPHRKKMRDDPETRANVVHVLEAGWQVEIHGWAQPTGPRGRWECTVVPFRVEAHDGEEGQ